MERRESPQTLERRKIRKEESADFGEEVSLAKF